MKLKKKILIAVISIIVFSNLPIINALFAITFDGGEFGNTHYRYSNSDGSFTFAEFWGGHDFNMMNRNHATCLLYRPNLKDKQIYRLFKKNPFAFWRWVSYFYSESYKLPYKDWEEIEKIRKRENIKETTGCSTDF